MVGITVKWGKRIGASRMIQKRDGQQLVYEIEHYDDQSIEQLGSHIGECLDMKTAIREVRDILAANAIPSDQACMVQFDIRDHNRIVTSDGWSYSSAARGSLAQL